MVLYAVFVVARIAVICGMEQGVLLILTEAVSKEDGLLVCFRIWSRAFYCMIREGSNTLITCC